jgi:NAD(P)-dependent dehydrogenase (short-subunit alcohol dehydrogenase family)
LKDTQQPHRQYVAGKEGVPNRLGPVEEVAALVLWLCSDAVSFNAGAGFGMSGGTARY